jgi:molecular chaperone DnaK (HSP70)
MEKNQIDEIVLSGGASRIPLIQKMVTDFFGKQPLCHYPEAAIAIGAALIAFNYSQKYTRVRGKGKG